MNGKIDTIWPEKIDANNKRLINQMINWQMHNPIHSNLVEIIQAASFMAQTIGYAVTVHGTSNGMPEIRVTRTHRH